MSTRNAVASEETTTTERDPLRVLLVEDDPTVAQLLAEMLHARGHIARAAHSIADAHDHYGELDPHVVVFDLLLGGGENGLDCHNGLREAFAEGDFAAVLLTAALTRDRAVEATNRGFVQILTKPLDDADDFTRAVESAGEMVRLRARQRALEQALRARTAELEASNAALRETIEELDRARAAVEATLHAVPFPLVVIGADDRPLRSNGAYARAFGESAEAVGGLAGGLLTEADVATLRTELEADDTVYLFDRVGPGHAGQGVFNIVARRADDAPGEDGPGAILVCLIDRSATRAMQARLARRRRLAALGSVSAGVAQDLLDPATFVKLNLVQLSEQMKRVRRGCDAVLERMHAQPTTQAALRDIASEVDESASVVEESVQGLRRMQRVITVMTDFLDETEQPDEPVELRSAVDRAVLLTRGPLRARCELHVRLPDLGAILARRVDLEQAFVGLLMAAGSTVQGWGVLRIDGARMGEAACVDIHLEDDRAPALARAAMEKLDIGDSLDVFSRLGGRMFIEYGDEGEAVMRVLLPVGQRDPEPA